MNFLSVPLSIAVLAFISFILVGIEYWMPNEVSFYLLLSPYLALCFLAKKSKYSSFKLATIRTIAAVITLLLVPVLLLGIKTDAQASLSLLFVLFIQLISISTAELIILFFINSDD